MYRSIIGCYFLFLTIVVVQLHANSFLYGVNLTDESGDQLNLTTTFYSVRISFYSSETDDKYAYRETFLEVPVKRGSFQLEIGNDGVDGNNNTDAKLPIFADQKIDANEPSYNYLEIMVTPVPLGDPVILSPRVKLPTTPVSQDSNKLGGLSPQEWESRIQIAKDFYTDSKAVQAAKDDGNFLVKNIMVDLKLNM